MDITVIITTKNRFFFLNRAIRYYQRIKFSGTILILDSSDKLIYDKQSKLIKSIKNIKINHYFSPYCSSQTKKQHYDKILTKYVTWSGDDDYHVTKGLKQCILELENNGDISAVKGNAYLFYLNKENNNILNVQDYSTKSNLSNDNLERFQKFIDHPRNIVTGVWRSSIFKLALSKLIENDQIEQECPDRFFYDDILLNGILITFGKIKNIKETQFVMTMTENRLIDKAWGIKIKYTEQKKSINYMARSISKIIDKRENLNLLNEIKNKITDFIKYKYNVETLKYINPSKTVILRYKLVEFTKKIRLYNLLKKAKDTLIKDTVNLSSDEKNSIYLDAEYILDNIKEIN